MFSALRIGGWNSYYAGRLSSPALFDLTQVTIAFAVLVITLAGLVVFVGSKGNRRWISLTRFIFSLQTAAVILVCVTGQDWQVATIRSRCPYSTLYSDGEMMADISVHVGLKAVNVTMTGSFHGGRVHYNERFSFNGIHAIRRDYATARSRGLPEAILTVATYFCADSGGLRWGRSFRESGHVTHLLLWWSLAMWILANFTICVSVVRGAALLSLAGCMMIGSVVLHHMLQPAIVMTIPFEDDVICLHYGWCFWLTASSGGLTVVTGLVLLVGYCRLARTLERAFLLDVPDTINIPRKFSVSAPLKLGRYRRQSMFILPGELEKITPATTINVSNGRYNCSYQADEKSPPRCTDTSA